MSEEKPFPPEVADAFAFIEERRSPVSHHDPNGSANAVIGKWWYVKLMSMHEDVKAMHQEKMESDRELIRLTGKLTKLTWALVALTVALVFLTLKLIKG